MDSETIKTELSYYQLEPSFASWLTLWLDENAQVYAIASEQLHPVSIGVSFEATQHLIAITLTFIDVESTQDFDSAQCKFTALTLIFSESQTCHIETIIDKKSTAEKTLPYELVGDPSRINQKVLDQSYMPAFKDHYKIHSLSESTLSGYHWVMLEDLGSNSFEVAEYLGFELADIHYEGESRQEAINVYFNVKGHTGYETFTFH